MITGIIYVYATGKYGRHGKYEVELNKVEYFKNGRVNKTKTLKNGYKIIRVIQKEYGFGLFNTILRTVKNGNEIIG